MIKKKIKKNLIKLLKNAIIRLTILVELKKYVRKKEELNMQKLMFKKIYCLNKFLIGFDRSVHSLTNEEGDLIIDRFVTKGELMLQGYYLKQMEDYISVSGILGESKNY